MGLSVLHRNHLQINQSLSDGNVIFAAVNKTCTVYDTVKSVDKWSEVPNYFKLFLPSQIFGLTTTKI